MKQRCKIKKKTTHIIERKFKEGRMATNMERRTRNEGTNTDAVDTKPNKDRKNWERKPNKRKWPKTVTKAKDRDRGNDKQGQEKRRH